jgi:tetratricopeptide (TPR) repeat protein
MNRLRQVIILGIVACAGHAEDCTGLLAALDRAAIQEPNNVDALLNVGVNRFRCGLPAEALQPLRKAVELAPDNSTAYFYLGVSLLALDRDEEAKNAFRRMATLGIGGADQLFILQKGYSRLAAALLQRMSEIAPDSGRLNQVRAEMLEMEHHSDQALEEYRRAVAKEPNVAALHYALGNAYWACFRAAEALAEFQVAIRIEPSHYMAHYKLGLALVELNRPQAAIEEFKKSLAIQPGLANAQFGLAKAYERLGSAGAALAAADECLKLDQNNQPAQYIRAQLLHKLGREREAQEQFMRVRAMRENSTTAP